MIIAVGDTRVYRFPQSTIIAEIHNDHAEILVLPDRRKFIVRLQPQIKKAMQATYPGHTDKQLLSTFVIKALEDGFLPTNEEI
jgi:hypothetical protein